MDQNEKRKDLKLHELKRNDEGYPDPTAYTAIRTIVYGDMTDRKASRLISILRFIIWESGFELLNRFELRHRETGKIYR